MAERISLSVFGDEIFIRKILAMRHRARDMSPVLRRVGEDFLDIVEDQFATEGQARGRRWRELTRDWALERGSKHPILTHTAEMLIEMTDPFNLDVSDHEVKLEIPESIRVKAEGAQFGYDNPVADTHVDPRPIVVISDFDRVRWRRQITNFLANGRI